MFCTDFSGIMTKQIKEILKEIVDIKRKSWGWKVLRYESGKIQKLVNIMEVKDTQLCLTLCDPMEYTVHGIL